MNKQMDDQGLVYGLDELKMNGLSLGFIKEGSFAMGGTKGEMAEVRAAQVKGNAIKNIPTGNGTLKPTFQLLQFNFETLAKVLGGQVIKKDDKAIGWSAPKELVRLEGFFEVFTDSGHVIVFPSAILQGNIAGTLVLTETATIDCELGINQPAGGENPTYLFEANEYTPYNATTNTPPTLPKDGVATPAPAAAPLSTKVSGTETK